MLRQWLSQPLVSLESIRERQDAVAELRSKPELLARIQEVCAVLPVTHCNGRGHGALLLACTTQLAWGRISEVLHVSLLVP